MSAKEPFESTLRLLAGTRTFAVVTGIHLIAALGMLFFPLVNGLGFERALATAFLSTLTTPALALTGLREQHQAGEDPIFGWGAAILLGGLLLVPSWTAGFVYETLTVACDLGDGSQFFVLLGGGNTVVSASITMAAFYWTPGGTRYGSLVIASTACILTGWMIAGLLRLYHEPQIFLYLAPFGFWPGSIYDESLRVPLALWAHRGFSLTFSLSLVCWARVTYRPRPLAALLGILTAGASVWLYLEGGQLGFRFDREYLRTQLNHRMETRHFVLYAAPTFSEQTLKALAREHEFRYEQLSDYFKVEPPSRIHSYVYSNAEEKGELMGAFRTQIARPWHQEIHINGAEVPHPVLKHELAHIFAGQLGRAPFRVPLLWGFIPNMGIIEGIAVAADDPIRELTVHQWAAAMKRLDRLPRVASSLDPAGFWSISSTRAYTVMGSFISWLIEHHGMSSFSKIYRGDSFPSAFAKSAADLERDWLAFLESIELNEAALRMAEHRFARPSIFEKTCARTASTLADRVHQHLRAHRLGSAKRLTQRLLTFQPADPSHLTATAWGYVRAEDYATAEELADKAHRIAGATEQSRARAEEVLAHIAWRRNQLDLAKERFTHIRSLHLSSASNRLQSVRIEALSRPESVQTAIRAYLERRLSSARNVLTLADLYAAYPDDPLVGYLFARRLSTLDPSKALRVLPPPSTLPSPELQDEAHLMKGRMEWAIKDFAQAAQSFDTAARETHRQSIRIQALDWAQRALHALRWE